MAALDESLAAEREEQAEQNRKLVSERSLLVLQNDDYVISKRLPPQNPLCFTPPPSPILQPPSP